MPLVSSLQRQKQVDLCVSVQSVLTRVPDQPKMHKSNVIWKNKINNKEEK